MPQTQPKYPYTVVAPSHWLYAYNVGQWSTVSSALKMQPKYLKVQFQPQCWSYRLQQVTAALQDTASSCWHGPPGSTSQEHLENQTATTTERMERADECGNHSWWSQMESWTDKFYAHIKSSAPDYHQNLNLFLQHHSSPVFLCKLHELVFSASKLARGRKHRLGKSVSIVHTNSDLLLHLTVLWAQSPVTQSTQ